MIFILNGYVLFEFHIFLSYIPFTSDNSSQIHSPPFPIHSLSYHPTLCSKKNPKLFKTNLSCSNILGCMVFHWSVVKLPVRLHSGEGEVSPFLSDYQFSLAPWLVMRFPAQHPSACWDLLCLWLKHVCAMNS